MPFGPKTTAPEFLRADQQQPEPGWAATDATRPGWSSSSSSTVSRWSCPVNQTSPRLPEPTTAIVDGIGDGGGSSSLVEVDDAVRVVLLASAARATVGPTPLLWVISDRNELTKVDPSALVFD